MEKGFVEFTNIQLHLYESDKFAFDLESLWLSVEITAFTLQYRWRGSLDIYWNKTHNHLSSIIFFSEIMFFFGVEKLFIRQLVIHCKTKNPKNILVHRTMLLLKMLNLVNWVFLTWMSSLMTLPWRHIISSLFLLTVNPIIQFHT